MPAPKRPTQSKGSRGRAPAKNTAQGRGGITRDTTKPVQERRSVRDSQDDSKPTTQARRYGSPAAQGMKRPGERPASSGRPTAPRTKTDSAAQANPGRKPLPTLRRVQLDSPPPSTEFVDRDGNKLTFPDSNLKRVAAQILSNRRKVWRYRPFSFPLLTDRGHEQAFHFDFYIYDAEDSVIRLLLVVPSESREVWDKVGRFKRQYPMYHYELWTPERLAQLSKPRAQLGF